MTADAPAERPAVREGALALLYLALAAGIELIVAHAPPFDTLAIGTALRLAVILDGLLMVAMLVHGAIEVAGKQQSFGRLLMALSMIPMARVVAQGLTLSLTIPEMGVYLRFFVRILVVALVLHAALYFLVRADRLNLGRIERHARDASASGVVPFFLGLGILVASPLIGFLGYAMLDPFIPQVPFDDPQIIVAVIALVVAALWQELAFRGVVLQDANRVFRWVGATALSGLAGTILLIGTLPSLGMAAWGLLILHLFLGTLYAAHVQASQRLGLVVVSQVLLQVSFFIVAPHYL